MEQRTLQARWSISWLGRMRGRSSRPRVWSLPREVPKKPAPARGGRWVGTSSPVALSFRMLPGEPRNVRTGDADIGQFAVVEARKFPHRSAIALPGVEEVDCRQKHFGILSSFVVESQLDIGSVCCAAKWNWCSAAKRILHVFCNNFSMIGLRKADFDRFSLNGMIFIMMVAQCFRDHRFV